MIEERRRSGKDRKDFLSDLLRTQDEEQAVSLSNQQARNELLSLFVAGHETTATSLTWCWYLLSHNPEIYARMRAEGDRVLASLPTRVCLYQRGRTSCPTWQLFLFKGDIGRYQPVHLTPTLRLLS